MKTARERHAACPPRALATRRQRHTHVRPSGASPPSLRRGGDEDGARATRSVSASLARDAASAAHTCAAERRFPSSAESGEGRELRESDTQRVRLARSRRAVGGTYMCGRLGSALPSLRRGGGGTRAARERHATCPPHALATRRRRHTHVRPSGACPPSAEAGGGDESGAGATRNVSASHARDAPAAARTCAAERRCPPFAEAGEG